MTVLKTLVKTLALAGGMTVAAALPAHAGSTFDAVKAKGFVQCGVNLGLYGFSAPDDKGNWTGLDVDACRAVAAAVFGDAGKVKFTPLSAQQRLPALQSGEVDLLARNTTWTLSRDTANGLNFTVTNYYDGQGFMVPRKLGVTSAKELDGATICVLPGTTSEQNLTDWFRANKMNYRPVVIEKNEELTSAFFSGRCDSFSSDTSQLAAVRANEAANPDDYLILPELISREPLTPLVRHADDQWLDVVRWSLFAMIAAEDKGITSKNVDQMLTSPDPEVKRMLGVTPGNGQSLGLDEKWAYNIVKQVGNYGESFERNVGKGSKLKVERGLNALYSHGGLMYSPPFK